MRTQLNWNQNCRYFENPSRLNKIRIPIPCVSVSVLNTLVLVIKGELQVFIGRSSCGKLIHKYNYLIYFENLIVRNDLKWEVDIS